MTPLPAPVTDYGESECRLCHCCLDAPDRHGEILGQWVVRAEQASARADQLAADLREYGRHQEGCSAAFNEPPYALPNAPGQHFRCKCGWDEATLALGATPTAGEP